MNNLYGNEMNFDYLPCCGFKFLNEEEIKVFDVDYIPDNSLFGYILEVDLEYPTFLHDLHNYYPLCPEKDMSVSIHERNVQILVIEKYKISINFSPPHKNEISGFMFCNLDKLMRKFLQ